MEIDGQVYILTQNGFAESNFTHRKIQYTNT